MGIPTSAELIRRGTFAELLSGDKPLRLPVELTWRGDDPWAVQLAFRTSRVVCWWIARELLAEGLHTPAGVGDVRVRPSITEPDRTLLELWHEGRARFEFDTRELAEFLDATEALVPIGAELGAVDFAAEIHALLDDDGLCA